MRITLFSSHSFRPLKTRSPLMRTIALGLSFSILTQGVVVPARAEVKSRAVEITSFDRVIFGPKEYVRGTDKVSRFPVQIPLPRELTSPFVLRITQGDPVVANIKVYGNPSISSTEFKPHGQILKEVFPPFPAVILEVLMEGPPGEKFTLELFGRSKVALPPPPQVTILNPLGGAWVGSTASGKVAFDAPGGFGGLTAKLDGSAVTLAVSSGTAEGPLTLTTEGTHTLSATVKDVVGQSANAAVTFKADLTPPQLTLVWPAEGTVVEVSTASFGGAVSDLLSGVRSVTCGGTPATVLYGRWACEVALTPGVNTVAIEAQDQVGNTAQTNRAITYQTAPPEDPTLPPDPAEVAPPLDPTVATSMATSTEFLYTGDNPIQVGVSSGTIKTDYVAVLRGKIIDRAGAALPGATVTVLGHPEYGSTKSRADGMFDMAVNGGGSITLTYEKDGYLTVQRQVNTPWQDWAVVDDAVMIPLDAKVTTVDLTAPVMQVAQGPVVTDESGPRQATLLFPAGTTAEKVNPDGTTEPLTIMKVRATEYTVGPKGPESMPGALPPTSGYTYAVELSADEALDAKTVKFSKPMSFYVDNFLHFPVGGKVPVGYYDRERGVWVPSQNGKIVKVLAPTGDLAELDIDGSDTPATATALLALGVTEDERRELAKLYTAGKTLWRVPITHMTPWDCNWPYGPPKDARGSKADDPTTDKRNNDNCGDSVQGGSEIDCVNQTVTESVPITGTPFTLNYITDRVPGHTASRAIKIPISEPDMPPSVKRMDVDITVAGVTTRRSFAPEASKKDVFEWDGKDAYGREVKGSQKAEVRIHYVYDATYREPADIASSFGLAGDTEIAGDRARSEVSLSRKSAVDLDSWEGKPTGIGGWTLDKVHAYQPSIQTLLLGDGSRRSVAGFGGVITTVAGNGERGFIGDGGPAVEAQFRYPYDVTVDSLGNIYIADFYNYCIRKVTPGGTITTVAGNGERGFIGDGGPAVEAQLDHPPSVSMDSLGNLYIADINNQRIRKVTPDGTITTVAGNEGYGFSGDGGPAVEAQLSYPYGVTVDSLGNIYIADIGNQRIRKVTPDGTISTVAGNGEQGFSGDGGPAVEAQLSDPHGVTVDSLGNIYIADIGNQRIRKVTPGGTISTVAGNGGFGFSGDGGPAVAARLRHPHDVAVDSVGNIYIADYYNHRIRKVTPDGTINTVAGNGEWGFSGDGGPAVAAQLSYPTGISVDFLGNIYIADNYNNRLRKVTQQLLDLGSDENAVPSEDGTALYVFDSAGRHLRTIGAKTRSLIHQFAYDPKGELLSIADGDGNVTTIERDVDGKPKAIIAPHGQRTELALDANGWLVQITNPAGGTHKAAYSENGLMSSFTDLNNNTSAMEYDDLGRLVYDRTAAGKVWTVSRGELINGKEVGLTTALGRTLKYRMQDLPTGDHLRVNTSADGRVTESLRKTDGSTTVTTPTGLVHTVKKTPDPRFKMAAPLPSSKQTMPSGLTRETNITRTVSLSDPNDPLSLTDETTTVTMNGQIYTTVFSSATHTISGMTPTGRKSVALLDTRGRVSQSKTGTLAPASYAYDAHGRLGELTQGEGADSRSAQFSYGTDGNLKTVTDALGRHVDFEHDVLGRVTKQTLPDGRETRTTYDANGNVTSITPPGRPAHIYTYDAGNQVSGYTAPSLGTGSTATTYAYDLEGHPTLITRPDGQTLTFNYNAGGQLSTVTTPSGTYGYSYDSAGRLSTLTESATGINLSYAYDGTLPLSTTWTGPVTGDVSRTYDNNFRTASQSVNGANTVNYAYDNDGLLTSAGDLSLTRDAENGLLSATTLGTVSDAWTYNSFGEATNYAAKVSGSDAYSATFTRDALGRITTKNETIGAESHNYVYTYDPSGRLTTVEKDATPTTYTYDANGNRLKKVASGVTTNGTYDAQDRLLTYGGNTYTYTDNGELKTKVDATGTTTYTYDVSGNLRNVTLSDGKAIEYLIDGQNRRAAKKVNGTLTQGFLYNDQLQIVAELDGAGTVVSRFVYADRSNVPSFMEKGGTTYRIIADQLGSPRLVVNSADGSIAQKLDYDEFGNVLTDTNPGFIPFAFAGGLYDQNTKLVRFGARDYDPENGRWTIKDPIRFQSGEMNLYGYGMNDPINFIDPTGLSVLGDFFSGSGSYFIGLWRFAQQMGRSFGMLGETAQYNAYREQEILADLIKFTSQNSTARNIAFNSACSYVKNNKARITGRFGTAFGVTLLTSSVPGLGPILSASALTGDVLHLTQQGVETLDAISQATEALLGGE